MCVEMSRRYSINNINWFIDIIKWLHEIQLWYVEVYQMDFTELGRHVM